MAYFTDPMREEFRKAIEDAMNELRDQDDPDARKKAHRKKLAKPQQESGSNGPRKKKGQAIKNKDKEGKNSSSEVAGSLT